jgi:glycosyltransferase involved in cell wall biosynthesis
MFSPLVSVIVPTYNRAHVVGRTIKSALAQTYAPIEVVVIDDGSTDSTTQQITRDWGDDSRVRYFKKTNGGPASARNAGFAQARGEYIALLDSDDTWQPWKLSLQIRCMEQHPELGMTWTDMVMIDEHGKVVDPAYLRHMYSAYNWFTNGQLFPESHALREVAPDLAPVVGDAQLRIGRIFSNMIMGNLVHTSTVVLRRERLEQVKGFNESLRYSGEDYDFHLRTCRAGAVGLLDIPAIRYQQGMPDRLTGKKYRIHMAENLLRTLEPVIAHDREEIDLPEHMLKRKLAEVHAWVAFERLELGETDEARKHYLISLKHWPWQPGLAKPLSFAAMPWGTGMVLRRWLQAARARLTGDSDGHGH